MARGFAALSKEQRIENSRRAGQRAHELGRAHTFSTEEAREAGKAGGRGRGKKQPAVTEVESESAA